MEDYPSVPNAPSAEVLGDKNVCETLPTALLTQTLTTLTNLHILHILQQSIMSDKGSHSLFPGLRLGDGLSSAPFPTSSYEVEIKYNVLDFVS